MKTLIYYHVSDHPGWQALIDVKRNLLIKTGVWQKATRIIFQLHYQKNSYTEWASSPWIVNDPRIELRYFEQAENISLVERASFKPLGETYSIIDLQNDMWALDEPHAVFRYSTKGITHRHDETWATAEKWNDYIDYWCIEQHELCISALLAGFDTVGCNWHMKDDPTGHWSGTVWWARSDYLTRLPRLDLPHLRLFQQQLAGFSARHDAEVWIGQARPRYLELDHYAHAVVYHVEPPNAEVYRLDASRAKR